MTLEEATEAIKAPDEAAMQAAKAWWDSRAKLPGSLGCAGNHGDPGWPAYSARRARRPCESGRWCSVRTTA